MKKLAECFVKIKILFLTYSYKEHTISEIKKNKSQITVILKFSSVQIVLQSLLYGKYFFEKLLFMKRINHFTDLLVDRIWIRLELTSFACPA